jgi:predicted permease
MLQILAVIAPLFLIIFFSALVQRYRRLGEEWSQVFNQYALKVGLPVLIFTALAQTPFSLGAETGLLVANSAFIIIIMLAGLIVGKVFKLSRKLLRTIFICLAFGNVAYLGIPVLVQTGGDHILPQVSLIVAVYLFWIFSLGIGYLEYGTVRKNENALANTLLGLIKNPLLLAVLFGLFFGGLGLGLPGVVRQTLEMITASVTPTVLIVIGLFIGGSRLGRWKEWLPALFFSLVTLLLLPAVFYFGIKFCSIPPFWYSTSIIQAAMPLAITPFALAERYGLDKNFIARSIVLSTVLSVITLPFWIDLLTVQVF